MARPEELGPDSVVVDRGVARPLLGVDFCPSTSQRRCSKPDIRVTSQLYSTMFATNLFKGRRILETGPVPTNAALSWLR